MWPSDVPIARRTDLARTAPPASRTGTRARGTIWIDLDNSPHVPFFAPILDRLHGRGFETVVTARDCFQVRELADLFHLRYTLIGRHSGKNRWRKLAGLCRRACQLVPAVFETKPDLAVSHCSRAQLIVAAMLGIPSLFIGDYEFATAWAFVQPRWMLTPDVIPRSAVGCDPRRVLQYPGIKEDVYVPRFQPDPRIRRQLGLDEEDLVVTIRPPANEAHYYNPESDVLFNAVVERLSRIAAVRLVALPRNDKQADALRARWPDLFADGRIRIPGAALDGLNLIWHSDLVVSGGGTMNREAAALDVPVYSTFRGRIGAVDRYLSASGRLVLLECVEDVQRTMRVARRVRPAVPAVRDGGALDIIVAHIARVMESTCAAANRQVAS